MNFSTPQIEIRYGSYSESPVISTELCIPSLYGLHRINVNRHETEIVIGISPKNFSLNIYITTHFGKILQLGPSEFIDFLENLDSYFAININFVFKPPIISIFKIDEADKYQINFINHEKIYMREKSILKLCEMKRYLISMINELNNDVPMYAKYFKEILLLCENYIIAHMSRDEIVTHLLDIPNDRIPKKIVLETILNFIDYCLIYAIQ